MKSSVYLLGFGGILTAKSKLTNLEQCC